MAVRERVVTLVIDASVANSWIFEDESHPRADAALAEVLNSGGWVPDTGILKCATRYSWVSGEVGSRQEKAEWGCHIWTGFACRPILRQILTKSLTWQESTACPCTTRCIWNWLSDAI